MISGVSHKSSLPYRPEVDGLRALAVLAVVFYHAEFPWFSGGFIGVDVFFVISGYLISGIILREREGGGFSFASFYERRARRILPPLFVVCLAAFPMAWMLMTPSELDTFGKALVAVAAFVPNVFFWRTNAYFTGGPELSPLLHTWSLGVEEQFYFFFPIALLAVLAFARRWLIAFVVLGGLVSLALSIWVLSLSQLTSFYLLPTRAWELLAGVFLAVREPQKNPSAQTGRGLLHEVAAWTALAAILVPIFIYTDETPFPGLAAVPPVAGTAVLIALARPGLGLARFLALRPVVAIGLVSYGFYLWHQPVFVFARMGLEEVAPVGYLALSALALVLSYASWRWIERPLRNRSFLSRGQVFALSGAGLVIMAAAGAALHWTKGAESRLPAAYRLSPLEPGSLREGCPEQVGEGIFRCTLGDPSALPTVALIGDSHAYALADQLSGMLLARGKAGILLHTDCHPIAGIIATNEGISSARIAHCARAHEALIETIRSERLEGAIVAVRWTLRLFPLGGGIDAAAFDNREGGIELGTPYRENLAVLPGGTTSLGDEWVSRRVAEYLGRIAAEVPTALVYPVPEAGFDPVRQVLKTRISTGAVPADLSTAAERYRERTAAVSRLLDRIDAPNLIRVRPASLLCDTFIPGRCAVAYGGMLFYYDNNHLSDAGAKLVLDAAMPRLLDSQPATAVSDGG